MDVDASERRKIKIYAGKRKKKNEEISLVSYAQSEWSRTFEVGYIYLQIMHL